MLSAQGCGRATAHGWMLHAAGRKLVCLHGCLLRFNKNNKIYHNEAFTVSYRASHGRMVVAGCMCVCVFVSFPPVHVLLLPLPLAAHQQQQQRGRRHRGCCRVSCRLPARPSSDVMGGFGFFRTECSSRSSPRS